jgi:FkbM family methyltransferase
MEVFKAILQKNRGVLVDFGCWIGPTVLWGAQWADRVIALDADPWAFEMALANIKLNPEVAAKTDMFYLCVNAERTQLQMRGQFPGRGGSSLVKGVGFEKYYSWTAPCMPLGELLQAADVVAGDVSLIKIDTEGAELFLLPALMPTLRALGMPTVYLSIHPQFWNKENTVQFEAQQKALKAAMEVRLPFMQA